MIDTSTKRAGALLDEMLFPPDGTLSEFDWQYMLGQYGELFVTIFGRLEYTAPNERLEFTAAGQRLEYTAANQRLEYTVQK